MKYHYDEYRVAPLSEWLARLTSHGYTVERAYDTEWGKENSSSFWVYDHRGLYSGLLIRYGAFNQYSRWASNIW